MSANVFQLLQSHGSTKIHSTEGSCGIGSSINSQITKSDHSIIAHTLQLKCLIVFDKLYKSEMSS